MPETVWDEIKKKVYRETALDIVWKITCGPQPNKCSYNTIPHMIPGWEKNKNKKTLLFTSRHVFDRQPVKPTSPGTTSRRETGPHPQNYHFRLWLLLWDGTDVSICWETSFLVLGQVRMVTLSKVNLCVKPSFPFWHLMDTLALELPYGGPKVGSWHWPTDFWLCPFSPSRKLVP